MTAGGRILYIDDDPGLGRLMQKALAPLGYDVQHALSGTEGMRLLAQEAFVVVALDHTLSDESGLDILPRIVAQPDAPPVIYVTGSEDVRVAVAALKAGAVDYVWKDVQGQYRELLGQSIAAALAQRRLQREKEEAERAVRAARDLAETLLDEVNHRVANSLSLVASLARLQAHAEPDERARAALQEIQARIAAIAGIHRRLYTSEDVRVVELGAYVGSLADELVEALGSDAQPHVITIEADDDLNVPTDAAVSLGVILTELVTNAFKYAYPLGYRGEIRVSLRRTSARRLRLVVADDGVGWSGSGAPKGTGLGSTIINAMASRLGTSVTYEAAERGTRATLAFDAGD